MDSIEIIAMVVAMGIMFSAVIAKVVFTQLINKINTVDTFCKLLINNGLGK